MVLGQKDLMSKPPDPPLAWLLCEKEFLHNLESRPEACKQIPLIPSLSPPSAGLSWVRQQGLARRVCWLQGKSRERERDCSGNWGYTQGWGNWSRVCRGGMQLRYTDLEKDWTSAEVHGEKTDREGRTTGAGQALKGFRNFS